VTARAPLLLALLLVVFVAFRAAEAITCLLSPDMVAVAFSDGGDDAYYYFTVARNVANGRGITIDGVHWTSGFQPLWALICSIAFLAGSDRAALAVIYVASFALWLLGAWLFLLIVRRASSHRVEGLATVAVVALFLCDWLLNRFYLNGMDTGLYCTLLLLLVLVVGGHLESSASSFDLRHAVKLGLVCGLVMLARNDGVFFCGFAMLAILIAGRTRQRVLEVAAAGFVASAFVLPWLAYCYWVLGAPVPQSGIATAATVRLVTAPYFVVNHIVSVLVPLPFVRMKTLIDDYQAIAAPLIMLGVLAMVFLALRPRSALVHGATRTALLAFGAACAAILIYYPINSSATQFYSRYFAPVKLLVFICLAVLMVEALHGSHRRLWSIGAMVGVTVAAISNASWVWREWGLPYKGYFGHEAYELRRSPLMTDGSSIGMMETGRLGFMLPTRITNLDGKMRVDSLRALQQGKLEQLIRDAGFDHIMLHSFDEKFFDERAPAWRSLYDKTGTLADLAVYSKTPPKN